MPLFLKYGNVKGEVTEPAHSGWIDLKSAQIAGRGITPSSGQGGSTPKVSEVVVTRAQDAASNALQRESLNGEGVFAAIDFLRDDGSVYLRLEMTQTLISGYAMSKGGKTAEESVTLTSPNIEWRKIPGTPPP
jgi:type VI secretion system secreted protein Hcp